MNVLACLLSRSIQRDGELLLAEQDRCGHKHSPAEGEAVAARMRDFGNQSVRAQQLEFPADAGALSVACGGVGRPVQSDSQSHISIAKAVDEVFAAQDR